MYMYPEYRRLVENPKLNREFYNRITSPEFIKECDVGDEIFYRIPDHVLIHREDIHPNIRIQKFFHPHTLPNEFNGNSWHSVKKNKEDFDNFIDYVQQFQDYTIDVTTRYTFYRCNYTNPNSRSGFTTSKSNCPHKITVQALQSGKYKIMWHLKRNHPIDSTKLSKITKQQSPTNLPWPKLKIPKPLILELENNKSKDTDEPSNRKSKTNFDSLVLSSLKTWVPYINSIGEFAVFKKRSINTDNNEFIDIGNSTLDPNSMWYWGIICSTKFQLIQNSQIVFLNCSSISSHKLYDDNVMLYSFFHEKCFNQG
ncbi:hypothetical protein MGS_03641 [Candida albicans P78042]|nr:hypothetical protein MG7_03623 [Candida albicans P34048]KGU30164.1 hypothetical protein MGK_03634 [Candida albicans P57055]KHC76474.1 hypothetical protein MGS_03641 [Candida albicans P78042]